MMHALEDLLKHKIFEGAQRQAQLRIAPVFG